MLSTHAKKVPGYQWDDKFEGTQGVKYLLYNYILQNVKVYSHQWQWISVQGQITLLTQVPMHSLGTISKASQTWHCALEMLIWASSVRGIGFCEMSAMHIRINGFAYPTNMATHSFDHSFALLAFD